MKAIIIVILLIYLRQTVSQECELCDGPCSCSSSYLNCHNLNLTSALSCTDPPKKINFSDNKLEIINWDFFANSTAQNQYCYNDFRNNAITASTGTYRTNQCFSVTLDLSYNALQELPLGFFETDSGGEELDSFSFHFNNNRIRNIARGSIIVHNRINRLFMYLQNNEISYIPSGAFDLHVSGTFTLYLRDNYIGSLSNTGFSHLLEISSLHYFLFFDNNNITTMEYTEELALLKSNISVMIYLNDNPIVCDCNLRWIADTNSSIRQAIQATGLPFAPRCNTPDIFKEHTLMSLFPQNFTCPPKLDPNATLNIQAISGKQLSLRCPFAKADPQVEFYDWVFTPSNPPPSPISGWDIQFATTTKTDQLIINNFSSEGIFKCTPLFPTSSLSVDINVSFYNSHEILNKDKYQQESSVFLIVLISLTCFILALLTALVIVIANYCRLLRKVKVKNTKGCPRPPPSKAKKG
ncbi:trophoblast glycoprotein-like [Apostichopus japonicus]|uniref:Trophoblast glycoprotein-like n=1 Tax=Stichopus japonicus TaxID=307972 RepID=A0A2G8LFB7_STIJA|nr:trophoblast glycoprotein-like [Apostichopus japonicus]